MVVRYNMRKSTFIIDYTIEATVTASGNVVADWIGDTLHICEHHLDHLIVGLDVEWCLPRYRISNRKDDPVAVLQLSVDERCLIFQLLHRDYIPAELFTFFEDDRFKFVGVGVADDVEKLCRGYDLHVRHVVDLRQLAAEKTQRPELQQYSLKKLGREIIGFDMEKPKQITLSNWGRYVLSYDQIEYAALDAYVSSEIGKRLSLGGFESDNVVLYGCTLP